MAGGVEAGFAAMGLGDLFDEGEAGAVGSEAVVFYAGALADAGACGWGVAFDEEDDVTVARKSTRRGWCSPVDCGARSCSGDW